MADDDVLPTDIDADAERFVDDDDDEIDPPDQLGPHDEGSEADVVDQRRAVPVADDDET